MQIILVAIDIKQVITSHINLTSQNKCNQTVKFNTKLTMLIPIHSQIIGPQKVDICFYDALHSQINQHKCSMGFYIVRFLTALSYFVMHLLAKDPEDTNISRMVAWLLVMIIVFNIVAFVFSYWVYGNFFHSTRLIHKIAQITQHSRVIDQTNPEQLNSWHEPLPGITLKVSRDCYQFENNIYAHQVDKEYKSRAERNCSGLIFQHISAHKAVKFWIQSLNLASVSMFTFAIILLCEGKGITPAEQSFIYVYLFTEVCSRFFIYFVLFAIGISPLVCLLACVWVCFCKKEMRIELPEVQEASAQIVRDCEGNCPVCFQDVQVGEKVIVLKCSQKHVFHELCIKGWTQLRKNTCPVCRAVI